MFSRRTDWDLTPNRLTRAVAARRRGGGPILDLTESNPTRCGLQFDAGLLRREISRPEIVRYDPEPFGPLAARQAIVDAFRLRDRGVDAAHVVLTASTSESYSYLFRLLADPGDRFLVPAPSYPLFPYLLRLDNLEMDSYPLLPEESFRIDLAALEAAAGPQTRGILVVHPGNPSGAFLKSEEAGRLREIARAKDLALISDEVFSGFAFAEDPGRLPTLAGAEAGALTFTLDGLSKTFGLPQLKVGWIVVSGPPDLRARALARLEVICDTFLSVNTPAVTALPAILGLRKRVTGKILARVRDNRKVLEGLLPAEGPTRLLPAEGGWYAVLAAPGIESEEDWCVDLLETHGVLVHPGYFFDFPRPGYLVLSLLPPFETFREALRRLVDALPLSGA